MTQIILSFWPFVDARFFAKGLPRFPVSPLRLLESILFFDAIVDSLYPLVIADVKNLFRIEGVCDIIKSPLAPLFEKGGTLSHRHCSVRP